MEKRNPVRMGAAQIRQAFLDSFAARGHTIVPSSSLVPVGERIPRVIPMVVANRIAPMVSSMVMGSRSARITATGLPVLMEVPRSPWRIWMV